jgi:16S rRNA (guanine527-N7)-methyltransferase
MDTTRIAELLQPFLAPATLSPTQLKHISTYIDLLLRWNARINLTAIRHPEEIVTPTSESRCSQPATSSPQNR